MNLLVVGALHWDVVVDAPRLPRTDETLKGSAVSYRFGGKGGNQALAAAQAGARVAFAGRVGSDEPGHAMRAELERAGVDVAQVQTGPGASGMSVAITVRDGGYGAVIVSGENLKIEPGPISIPEGCGMVLFQNEIDARVMHLVAEKAAAAGAEIALNAAPALGLDAGLLPRVGTLIVNRVEGADLLGVAEGALTPGEIVEGLHGLAPKARVILTLGGDGVAFAPPGGAVAHAPARKARVLSTHGAGDVFTGSYAAAILDGAEMADAIDFAQGLAARHISQRR